MLEKERRELLDKDRTYVWHPFTQMKDYAERDHLLVERAEGVFVYDAEGNRYYDTNSSWWVNVHGHGHPRLREAAARQMEQIDHTMFSGMTHRPGIELAEQLVRRSPAGLDKVFYSDNGSTAVEVALKMSFQYWRQSGKPDKTKFVFLDGSYHGDTIGAVSVGGVDLYHSIFKPMLFHAYRVPSPSPQAEGGVGPERALDALRELFAAEADRIAGIIVEPMIQAAGGMLMHPADYVAGVRELCTRYGVHMIADEVAVGFGRTGRLFACEHAGVTPDFMCLSKGLTAGIVPLSATLATAEVFEAFYDDYERFKQFFHGHSFTGNPVACAIALESLRMLDEPETQARMAAGAEALAAEAQRFAARPHTGRLRTLGHVAAFELFADAAAGVRFDSARRTGFQVYLEGLREGLLLRPLGDTLYFWLPLCVEPEQVRDIADRTERVLDRLGL
ncbi:adenosylmethionine--8-amino-7-oxononanoate transaminase [Paenibacillus turpanensis]|uniref:adenosylmethionine--8-amino-7-oxononanoate transaminase n=1 Tax=Paenibacillus turpanensis TaxID=2689078 RepID=UPI00140863E3|nr:adenosylmethionine--8-amino-7-oxononanoate transaminase [Paenibacillus turpanensis]